MSNSISKFEYSTIDLLLAGIVCSISVCFLVLLHGFIAVYYIPSSVLLNSDVLFWRMSWGIFSYFTACVLTFYSKQLIQNRFPVWFSISFIGSAIFILSVTIFLIVGRLILDNFYQSQDDYFNNKFSFPMLPTAKELLIPITVFLVCFAFTISISYIAIRLKKRISKSV